MTYEVALVEESSSRNHDAAPDAALPVGLLAEVAAARPLAPPERLLLGGVPEAVVEQDDPRAAVAHALGARAQQQQALHHDRAARAAREARVHDRVHGRVEPLLDRVPAGAAALGA